MGMTNELETKEAGSPQSKTIKRGKTRHVTFYCIKPHFHFHPWGRNTTASVLK